MGLKKSFKAIFFNLLIFSSSLGGAKEETLQLKYQRFFSLSLQRFSPDNISREDFPHLGIDMFHIRVRPKFSLSAPLLSSVSIFAEFEFSWKR